MSVPHQKLIYIDKTTPHNSHYFKIDQETFFSAAARLNQSGLIVYMYFMTLVPDSYDYKPNPENKRTHPFEFSSAAAAEVTNKDTKTMQRGIQNLIDTGYLIHRQDNLYQFIDTLPEDKGQTMKEHEFIVNYQEELKNHLNMLKNERQEQLNRIAEETLNL